MARINRTDVIQKAVNDLAISISDSKVPNETLDKVQLTYDLNKNFSSFCIAIGATVSGAAISALPTVSNGAETYITAVSLGVIKDVTCDMATGGITMLITPDASNVSVSILAIPILTLTAQSDNVTLALPYPLKVKNGTNISISGTFTAGNMRRQASVIGYTTSSN